MAFQPVSGDVLISGEIKELGPASEILKLLECPICQGVPFPPIWNCENGHIACGQCRSQLGACGLCRQPFSAGRNLFMEAVVENCKLTCPYADDGCTAIFPGHFMKNHASECKFGPKIKWMAAHGGELCPNAVIGGHQNGVRLYVIRAHHTHSYMHSITPGKLLEYNLPGVEAPISKASLPWGGGERFKQSYEVLVAPPENVKWVPSQDGESVPRAIIGGTSEDGETLFIGRFKLHADVINGKIHPSHGCCYIGVDGQELSSKTYEILVKVDLPVENMNNVAHQSSSNNANGDMPDYYS